MATGSPGKGRKKLLGEYLIDSGLVSRDQVEKALEAQKKAGSRLGQTLMELGFLKEDDLVIALAQQLGLAHIDLLSYRTKPEIVKLIPEQTARSYELLALDKVGEHLTVAMADPLNVFAVDEIQKITHCRIEPVICTRSALHSVFEQCYGKAPAAQPAPPAAATASTPEAPEIREKEPRQGVEGQEIIQTVDDIIRTCVLQRATDIHIEPDEEYVRVRCRIDGFLRELRTYARDVQLPLISRIKVMAGLDISEKRIPQDGRLQFEIDKRSIDLRVSTLPTVAGEKIVMRVLDKAMVLISMDKIGFLAETLRKFDELVHRPYGMILVTGPTSSGKTTTLYSALNTINTVERNILTVEDPVEYRIKMINQVQVNPRAGLTFAAGLRSFLRQDPNVIMIGEIRDLETAEIAVQAALTGHLVLSTIHTNNAPSTITRLVDMKVESFLVASAVCGILAQRLLRTICPHCKQSFTPEPEALRGLEIPAVVGSYTFYRGAGCEQCSSTGYRGRTGIYELMVMSDEIRELVLRRASTAELTARARKAGMQTLREDGLTKVVAGITTVEEVLRVTAEEAQLDLNA